MLSKILPASAPALWHKVGRGRPGCTASLVLAPAHPPADLLQALLASRARPGLPAGRRARPAMASGSLPASAGRQSLSVAVVGSGAAGLVAARELEREGHAVTVYEAGAGVGGVWSYTEEAEDDPLGLDPGERALAGAGAVCTAASLFPRGRPETTVPPPPAPPPPPGCRRVHNSMYAGLRTNLPREVMGYADFPFDRAVPGSQDPRQFPSHSEVQLYIEAFAERYNLSRLVQHHTTVEAAAPLPPGGSGSGISAAWQRWQLSLRRSSGAAAGTSGRPPGSGSHPLEQRQFDALVVCNGHYSEPRLPTVPGQGAFPGAQLHSHNYRRPERFRGQTGEGGRAAPDP